MRLSINIVACCLVAGIVGCSGRPARVPPPSVDAAIAGQQAIDTYDQDGNGALSREELQACPSLLGSFGSLDTDSSDDLISSEIEARIQGWLQSKAGLVSCRLRIMLDGRPLSGAEVVLEPVSFLAAGVLPASGVTTRQGYVQLSVPKEHLPAPTIQAMNWGFYDVKVMGQAGENGGANSDLGEGQSLGVEVTALGKNEAVIKLRSKGQKRT